MKLYQLYLMANTPVGVFTGFASEDFETEEEACTARDEIQETLRQCDGFTFFSDRNIGTEITICKTAIENTVFEFSITNTGD